MSENSKIYDLLVRVKDGYDPGWRDLRDTDDLLEDIRFNKKNPGLSVVTIEFDDYDDFFKLFEDISRGDRVDLISYLNRDNSNYEYYSRDSSDWEYGYVYGYLDEENKERIDWLSDITYEGKPDDGIELKMKDLYNKFQDDIDDIISDWSREEYDAKMDSIMEDLKGEFSNLLVYFGVRDKYFCRSYTASVNILLRLFQAVGDKSQTLFQLLKSIIDRFDKKSHGWYDEMYHEAGVDNFNYESFNRQAKYSIDRIFESIEDSEEFLNFDEYVELTNLIGKEYGMSKWNQLKRDPNLSFKVDKVDSKTNKILISFKNEKNNTEEKRLLTYDELKTLESQYELFNERRKIIKNLLRSI